MASPLHAYCAACSGVPAATILPPPSSDQLIIFCMGADPEPEQALVDFHSEGAVSQPNADRAIGTNLFKMQRGVGGVHFQKIEVLVGKFANQLWQSIIGFPETSTGEMFHSVRLRSARWSDNASSASFSSLPDLASCSMR